MAIPAPYDLTNAFPAMTSGYVSAVSPLINNATGAFANLETATSFYLAGSTSVVYDAPPPTLPSLISITFDSLFVRGFAFPANPVFAPELQTVQGTVRFESCKFAGALPVMPALTGVQNIEVAECSDLSTMAGAFPLVSAAQAVRLTNLPALTTMAGAFPSLISCSSDVVVINTGLIGIDGLAVLATIDDYLYLEANNSLVNLNGFAGLVEINKALDVQAHAALTSCAGLLGVNGALWQPGGLLTGHHVRIVNNPLLPTAAQAGALIANLQGEGYNGPVFNTGNGAG